MVVGVIGNTDLVRVRLTYQRWKGEMADWEMLGTRTFFACLCKSKAFYFLFPEPKKFQYHWYYKEKKKMGIIWDWTPEKSVSYSSENESVQ